MKTIMDIIKARKSIRAYKDKTVPKNIINDILEAAKHAPTARNMQELEYKVVIGKALINKISEGMTKAMMQSGMPPKGPPGGSHNHFHNAPVVIIVTAPKDNIWAAVDAGIAMQTMLLYATSVDLVSCVIGMARIIEKDSELVKLLHINDNMTVLGAVVCGYAAENPEPKEKKLNAEFIV
jgi:nitroreductase